MQNIFSFFFSKIEKNVFSSKLWNLQRATKMFRLTISRKRCLKKCLKIRFINLKNCYKNDNNDFPMHKPFRRYFSKMCLIWKICEIFDFRANIFRKRCVAQENLLLRSKLEVNKNKKKTLKSLKKQVAVSFFI